MPNAQHPTSAVAPRRWFSFAAPGSRHPMEDAVRVADNGRVFAVADGVTQVQYANRAAAESGPGQVARLFVERTVALVQDRVNECSDAVLADACRAANDEIAGFNRRKAGAWEEDSGAVAAIAYLCDRGHVHYAAVGDSRVRIFDARLESVLVTADQVAPLRALLTGRELPTLHEQRAFAVAHARNRADARGPDGARIGYGVFNGEPGVEALVIVGRTSRPACGYLILHTDGCDALFHPERSADFVGSLARCSSGEEFDRTMGGAIDAVTVRENRDDAAAVFVAL